MNQHDLDRILDAGREWDLAPVLAAGGAVIFGSGDLAQSGAQAAAAVHACLATGKRVVAIGPLSLTPALAEMRARVSAGGSAIGEAGWGVLGAGFPSGLEWQGQQSLEGFRHLWNREAARAGAAPEPVTCYPFLANGAPQILPGMAPLRELARGAAIVAAMSPFRARSMKDTPVVAARKIADGLALLCAGDYAGYQAHCEVVGSDGADVGQVVRYLVGPCEAKIRELTRLDLVDSTWQATALIELSPMQAQPEISQ